MKYIIVLFAVVFAGFFANVAFSDEMENSDPAANAVMPANANAAPQAVEVGNTICPVSGEKIVESKVFKHEYNGKIYNFCCSMCLKDFNKDPEKYAKIAEESMQKGAATGTDTKETAVPPPMQNP